jgi:hypothetical protein
MITWTGQLGAIQTEHLCQLKLQIILYNNNNDAAGIVQYGMDDPKFDS